MVKEVGGGGTNDGLVQVHSAPVFVPITVLCVAVHRDASPIEFHSKHRAASVVFAPLLTASGHGMGSFSCQ